MANLALALKKDGLVEKHGLRKYVHADHSGGNVVFKDPFSSIENDGLGIESIALKDIKEKRARMTYFLLDAEFLTKSESCFHLKGCGVQIMTPVFAIYSLDSPYCEFTFETTSGIESDWRKELLFPKELPRILLDSLFKAIYTENEDHSLRLARYTSIFNGLVPSKVKEEIKDAKQYFGNQIYIVGEAKWTFKISAPKTRVKRVRYVAPEKDPLVIGVLNNSCYLISEFDTTPIEELVAKNYVKK